MFEIVTTMVWHEVEKDGLPKANGMYYINGLAHLTAEFSVDPVKLIGEDDEEVVKANVFYYTDDDEWSLTWNKLYEVDNVESWASESETRTERRNHNEEHNKG